MGNGGLVYLSQDDVEEQLDDGVGSRVSFIAYADGNGVGAMDCRPLAASGKISIGKPSGGGSGGTPWQTGAPALDHETVSQQVHDALNNAVWHAVEPVDLPADETWSPQELSKRVVRYFSKGMRDPELLSKPWPEAVAQFV